MRRMWELVLRNTKMYFKDIGMFLTSLITPAILLILFMTFLGSIYKNSFVSAIPNGLEVSDKLINGLVAGQLSSAMLATSCVTVAFCSNLLMVQDRANGTRKDLIVSPIKKTTLGLSYFLASILSTLIVNLTATMICFIYIGCMGWFLSVGEALLAILDVILLTLFGVSLASCINYFLNTQGQAGAVGTIVSSCYGFVCGAYMPISSYGKGLQNFMAFLPGTYGTGLIRNHMMNGALDSLSEQLPSEAIKAMKDSVDVNLYFFDNGVEVWQMYLILLSFIVLFIALYLVFVKFIKRREN
jgi:multidrug/hemolysin transport system permease protein